MVKFAHSTVVLLLGIASFGFATNASAADIEAGKTKSAACAACHGADGNSTNPLWPNLAGQHANYIVKQLADFKAGDNGDRPEPTMSGMAAALSDEDMAQIGSYFEAQTPKPGAADKDAIQLGERLYRGGNADTGVTACMACHGPTGAGNPAAKYPALAGQHAQYTVKQLEAFRSGTRKNDPAGMMRSIANRMSAQEMAAVAQYIAGLH